MSFCRTIAGVSFERFSKIALQVLHDNCSTNHDSEIRDACRALLLVIRRR